MLENEQSNLLFSQVGTYCESKLCWWLETRYLIQCDLKPQFNIGLLTVSYQLYLDYFGTQRLFTIQAVYSQGSRDYRSKPFHENGEETQFWTCSVAWCLLMYWTNRKTQLSVEGASMNSLPSSSLWAPFCLCCIFRHTVFSGNRALKNVESSLIPEGNGLLKAVMLLSHFPTAFQCQDEISCWSWEK